MNKRNFFSVLYSVCTGTSLFAEIVNFKIIKSLWHLLILVILASLSFAFVSYSGLKTQIETGTAFMQKNFGDIVIENKGIFPSFEKGKEKHLNYNYMSVDYLPDQSSLDKFKFAFDTSLSGFIWTPFKVIGWLKLNDSQVVVYPAVSSQYDTRFLSIYPKEQFENYIKYSDKLEVFTNLMLRVCIQSDIPVVGAAMLKESNPFSDFIPGFALWSTFIVFFKFFISAFFNVIFYALIFAAIYAFTEKGGILNYKLKNFFVLAIYVSFPAIIIGTIFESVQTQYLEYSTVFIIVFVIYLFVVTNQLKRNSIGKKQI